MADIRSDNDDGTIKGYSYETAEGHYMVRCHQCGKENWAMAVSTGVCAWCGFDANSFDDLPAEDL